MPKPLPALAFTDKADSEIFETFFAAYQKAFVLPDEMETREGFAACLAQNHGALHQRLKAHFGAFRELCVVGRDSDGTLVGGANFIAMPHAASGTVTANLNYVFVDPPMRGNGWFRPLVSAVRELIAAQFPGSGEVLVFIEQNDPLLLSEEAYRRDSEIAGIDQFDRLRIWSRQGALVVDFPYAQPPLSAGQQADDGLIYSVLGQKAATLDACVFLNHLRTFFGVSVLKGQDLASVPVAQDQIAALTAQCNARAPIGLLDPSIALAGLDKAGEARLLRETKTPFRNWLKQGAAPGHQNLEEL